MKTKGRYCLQKLISYDPATKTETWKLTEWCDDKVHVLQTFFLAEGYRIFDTELNREVRRNVDLGNY